MALPVLDGNQTATTLSSVVTGGEHIVAHSVVSLGSAAISNITSAVSGSVVSISNFPATQPVSIASVTVGNSLTIGSLPAISGTVILGASMAQIGSVTASISGTVPVSISSVTVGNSVTIGSLPAISGTVTVSNATTASAVYVKICGERNGAAPNEATEIQTDDSGLLYVRLAPSNSLASDPVVYDPVAGTAYINVRQQAGTSITIGSLPAISGTVTANVVGKDPQGSNLYQIPVIAYDESINPSGLVVPVQITNNSGTLNSANPLPISGTVTIGALPSGSLTTRFGSVTTANTAQITSAVTNTSRKYLLAQNISAGTVTIGIGFSPTTTQGIQLTAGAGLTFDAFCPTGAVYWLGAVTGAAFTILEG